MTPSEHDLSVAVVSLACRFPGARDPDAYFAARVAGVDAISRFGPHELERSETHPRFVPARGILGDALDFDPEFFGYTRREAEVLDPQHRIALECCWEALESHGHAKAASAGRTGVFFSANLSTWLVRYLLPNEVTLGPLGPALIHQSNTPDQVAARIAYRCGLTGPVFAVQSACSSSLVAVHLAVQSLLTGECDAALAGGVSITLPERTGYVWQPGGLNSTDGRVLPFDARASGTVFSNGAGVVLLRRLSDALADGDTIHAVVRGSAVGNDGGTKVGFSAPSVDGQARVVADALRIAGVRPSELGFVEAHGTGTALGDPIEVRALRQVFASDPEVADGSCVLGSSKANLGHLDNAAGIAGFIDAVLAVREGVIPGTLGYTEDNPHAPLAGTPFRVTARATSFPDGKVRRAGVSAFGVGGTNAHVVVEQPPAARPAPPASAELLVASAPSRAQLAGLVDALRAAPAPALSDLARTLAGRAVHPVRRVVVADDVRAGLAALSEAPDQQAPDAPPEVVLLFPGQGRLDPAVVGALCDRFRPFRDAIDACSDAASVDLRNAAAPAWGQAALFAVEYALATWVRHLGVRPSAVLGHSLGEYAAAVVAGVWSVGDALALLRTRGELVDETAPGAMLAIGAGPDRIPPHDGVELAAVNGPDQVVVTGDPDQVDALARRLAELGIASARLPAGRALHSAALDPILPRFAVAVRDRPATAPSVPFVSSLTGTWVTDEVRAPEYWVRQLREPVRFDRALEALRGRGPAVWLELGPTAALGGPQVVRTLRPNRDPVADVLGAVVRLVEAGVDLDLEPLAADGARRVRVPLLPLNRTTCAVPLPHLAPASFHVPSWTRPPSTPRAEPTRRAVVVFTRGGPLGEATASHLRSAGHTVTVVIHASDYHRVGPETFRCPLDAPLELQRLLTDLRALALTPSHVMHLLSAEPSDDPESGLLEPAALARALESVARATELTVLFAVSGACDVLGTEPLSTGAAMTAAVARVIGQEVPTLRCRVVDVDRDAEPAATGRAVADELGASEVMVAVRGRSRWLPRYDTDPGERTTIDGTVLLTGGTGGVGLELARAVADAGARAVVLVARRATAAERDPRVIALRAQVDVELVDADVTDREALHRALERARSGPGGLVGVVHAAGVAGGELLALAEPAHLLAVVRPKADGARLLLELTAHDPLRFVSLVGSTASWFGGRGQGAYAAANAALDSLARSARRLGRPVTTVAWDTWRGLGMAAGDDSELTRIGIEAAEGRALFLESLGSRWAELAVSRVSVAERHRPPVLLRAAPSPTSGPARPIDPPRNEIEEAVVDVFQQVLGVSALGVNDDFFDLGGQSLMASQAVGRLRDLFDVDLPVLALFEGRTPAEVAQRIEQALLDAPETLL